MCALAIDEGLPPGNPTPSEKPDDVNNGDSGVHRGHSDSDELTFANSRLILENAKLPTLDFYDE